MLAYTYYTTETTRPTEKLTARNFQRVFNNDFTLVKINPITIEAGTTGTVAAEKIKSANRRLFIRLSSFDISDSVRLPDAGECSYLLFTKFILPGGAVHYRLALTSGEEESLNRLLASLRRMIEFNNSFTEALRVDEINRKAAEEQVVPAKPKAIKFSMNTLNTECYICMMDFTEDPDVTLNPCCVKLAHTACYSHLEHKNKCSCCRADLE